MTRPALRRPAAALLVAAALLAGCGDDGGGGEEARQSATSTPTPATSGATQGTAEPRAGETPSFTPRPVDGTVAPGEVSVNDDHVLGFGATPEVDNPAVLATIERTKQWLDAHLTQLQSEGGAGRLTGHPVLQRAAGPAATAVTTGLAEPARPVASASYRIVVYHDPRPSFVRARVTTRAPDGSEARGVLGFRVTEADELAVTVLGTEGGR